MTLEEDKFRLKLFGVLLIALLIALCHNQSTPVPVEELTPSPKQSPYVVLYFVCERIEHVLVTSEPPMQASRAQPGSQEMLDVIGQTPEERFIDLRYAGPECFYTPPEVQLYE